MRRADPGATLTTEQGRAAAAGLKAMMPIGRPFLDYVLSALADAGLRDICLVVPPDHSAMKAYYTETAPPVRVRLRYAVQEAPRGTADALLAARQFAAADHVLVLNADNYYPIDAYRALATLGAPGVAGFDRDALVRLGNIDADRIRRYAILRVDIDGFLEDIVEKPDDTVFRAMRGKALVSMNLWTFPPAIFDACGNIGLSPRGELELPDAVRYATRTLGVRFRVLQFASGVLDLASRGDVASVAARLSGVVVSP